MKTFFCLLPVTFLLESVPLKLNDSPMFPFHPILNYKQVYLGIKIQMNFNHLVTYVMFVTKWSLRVSHEISELSWLGSRTLPQLSKWVFAQSGWLCYTCKSFHWKVQSVADLLASCCQLMRTLDDIFFSWCMKKPVVQQTCCTSRFSKLEMGFLIYSLYP